MLLFTNNSRDMGIGGGKHWNDFHRLISQFGYGRLKNTGYRLDVESVADFDDYVGVPMNRIKRGKSRGTRAQGVTDTIDFVYGPCKHRKNHYRILVD